MFTRTILAGLVAIFVIVLAAIHLEYATLVEVATEVGLAGLIMGMLAYVISSAIRMLRSPPES